LTAVGLTCHLAPIPTGNFRGRKEAVMSVSRSGWSFLRRWWPVLAAAVVTVAVAGVVGLGLFIQSAAHDQARAARRQFPGDEVEALLALVQSERHALSARNKAVWALGQLRDSRALQDPHEGRAEAALEALQEHQAAGRRSLPAMIAPPNTTTGQN
jgi:hypothetical protein